MQKSRIACLSASSTPAFRRAFIFAEGGAILGGNKNFMENRKNALVRAADLVYILTGAELYLSW
jgi:hypothetical protein